MNPERQLPSIQLSDEVLARAERLVAEWPELSPQQLAELRLLLRPEPTPQRAEAA